MDTEKKIRIVLAEDHQVMRQGLRYVLEQYPDFDVVGEAGNGEEALKVAGSLHPDILLSDIRLPLLNGIGVVRHIKKLSPKTKVLILSAYDDDEYVLELMWAGAAGYLLKTISSNELAEAVRKVNSGSTVLHPEIAAKIARLWANTTVHKNEPKELTIRETELLRLAGEGLSNKAIAEKLELSVRTVEKHFNNILGKLSVSSRKEAIRYGMKRHLIDITRQ
ncbi:MAG: response regulator transcription factor [Chloroflexi bacterium]|nr:response regulator transcription factor [Chloroflexota bacterium]